MSLAVGASSKHMVYAQDSEGRGEKSGVGESGDEREDNLNVKRTMSEASLYATENEEDGEGNKIELGPQYTLKQQLEKDKDDESLMRWKEQLLGAVDMDNVGEMLEPEVKIVSLSILSPGSPEIVLPIPEDGKPKGPWFTLKEGSRYNLRFSFLVNNNIVSGFKYTNTVWKTGVKGKPYPNSCQKFNYKDKVLSFTACLISVDNTKEMLGTLSPQQEPYTYEMPEETTPSGFLARGSYTARSKFLDDDNKCYLEINYYFDIKKDWAD